MRVLLSALLWIQAEAQMSERERTKLVHEGNYVAEVDVELLKSLKDGHLTFLLKTRIVSTMYERLFVEGTLRPLQNIHLCSVT